MHWHIEHLRSLSLAGLLLPLLSCVATSPSISPQPPQPTGNGALATLVIQNPSLTPRQDEPLRFALADLGIDSKTAAAGLTLHSAGQVLASQLLDENADGTPDQLFWLAHFTPAQTRSFEVRAGQTDVATPARAHAEISHKIGGNWQDKKYLGGRFQSVTSFTTPPGLTDHAEYLRYEGPGIESDRTAFRIYLDWRNGFDIFGKSVSRMVLPEVGLDGYESYHHQAAWGMDLLKVGPSLGAGGFGYWDGKSVQHVATVDSRQVRILADGPLAAALRIDYNGWQLADQKVSVSATLSMHGGSRLLHNQIKVDRTLGTMAIGLVKHPGTQFIRGNDDVPGHSWTYIASYGPQSLAGATDQLGMAIFFKRGAAKEILEDSHNHFAVIDSSSGELDYYIAAAWQQEPGGIADEAGFRRFLEEEAARLTLRPRSQLSTARTNAALAAPLTGAAALGWARRLADSELTRQTPEYRYGGWDLERKRPTTFEYTTGLLLQAYDDLYRVSKEPRYRDAVLATADSFVSPDGNIHSYDASKFNIDSINSGNLLLRALDHSNDNKYRLASDRLRAQLRQQPRTKDGAFWHKKIYPHQLWLDGVYMGMPFLADYSRRFEHGESWPEVVKEFTITRERLRDSKTGLYFHGWDEARQQAWANPATGQSSQFWARGTGWLTMALVDVLAQLPADTPHLRQPLQDMVVELAETLARYQDPQTGVWFQILDQPNGVGNYRESSASAMFVYFYAKAINKGYLPSSYRPLVERAYQGLLREFMLVHPDERISLTGICQVAGLGMGRDGSYQYYLQEPIIANDAKGTGPFIMASVQMAALLGT